MSHQSTEQVVRITDDAGNYYEMSRNDWVQLAFSVRDRRATERRQFAAMAMQGLLSNTEAMRHVQEDGRVQMLAKIATHAADALVEALGAAT